MLATFIPGMRRCLESYKSLVKELDQECARVSSLHQERIRCRPGCSGCCEEFSVLAIEAIALAKALRECDVRPAAVAAGKQPSCPLLHRDRCLVYEARPIICRTQGLPIGYPDFERQVIEVSACEMNFPPDLPLATEALLILEPFLVRLAAINIEAAGLVGVEEERRFRISEVVGNTS